MLKVREQVVALPDIDDRHRSPEPGQDSLQHALEQVGQEGKPVIVETLLPVVSADAKRGQPPMIALEQRCVTPSPVRGLGGDQAVGDVMRAQTRFAVRPIDNAWRLGIASDKDVPEEVEVAVNEGDHPRGADAGREQARPVLPHRHQQRNVPFGELIAESREKSVDLAGNHGTVGLHDDRGVGLRHPGWFLAQFGKPRMVEFIAFPPFGMESCDRVDDALQHLIWNRGNRSLKVGIEVFGKQERDTCIDVRVRPEKARCKRG